eukprot:gnl/TRDRNA2_/TRDRNA2_71764_c1_seq1.p1 gnl/TRDRNA2_/TRDRNA2_71764_c1~~gnl/TRDRNA2_/TRDRNA2_71764_c1_seq1.p1  ORF type:complete len:250 (-),score=36.44 gnl/TRDRNA2_/TRDRNA2_71764_c1_seq1:109-858(-)
MAGFNVVDTRGMPLNSAGFEIIGGDQQVLHMTLSPGESCWAEPGCMIYCDNEVRSQVDAGNDGCFGMFKRVCCAGDSLFRTHWKNTDGAKSTVVVFGANFPAKVIPVNLDEWRGEVFVKYGAFLAAQDPYIRFNIERAGERAGGTVSKGMMAGQGFVLNKIAGKGWIFLAGSGAIAEKSLGPGETVVVDRLCVVAWQSSCSFDFRWSGGVGMMCCGGEGFAETTITGPGKVIVQSMPFERTRRVYGAPK